MKGRERLESMGRKVSAHRKGITLVFVMIVVFVLADFYNVFSTIKSLPRHKVAVEDAPSTTADTTAMPAIVLACPFRTRAWETPTNREMAEVLCVNTSGSDTVKIPPGADILVSADSTYEYEFITPFMTYKCKGNSCPGLEGRFEWVSFRSRYPGSLTFWFEPHTPIKARKHEVHSHRSIPAVRIASSGPGESLRASW